VTFSKLLAIALTAGLALVIAPLGTSIAADDAPEPIIYIKTGTEAVSARLVPDQEEGTVCNDPELVELTADDKSARFQLSTGEDGHLDLNGKLPGLADGRHRSAIKTLTPDGAPKDRKQVLLFVDSVPPVIELIDPPGDNFPRGATAIRLKITDPEDGSGVSVDPAENALEATLSGGTVRNACFAFANNELQLLLQLEFPENAAAHDSPLTLSVSLQDRAGNIGRLRKSFTVRSLVTPAFEIYKCGTYSDSFTQTAGEFLVQPSPAALTLKAGQVQSLDILTYGCSGKHTIYPPLVQKHMGMAQAPEIFAMQPYFQKTVGDRIEITSPSGWIEIHRLEDEDFTDSRITFHIRQKMPVSMGEQMDILTIKIPVASRINPAEVDFCEAERSIDHRDPQDSVYAHIAPEAYVFTFETLTIPVFLETAAEPLQWKVYQEADQLAARIDMAPPELIDTGASWFEFEGERYWFSRAGESCVAQGPALEGLVHFKLAAAHQIAEFHRLQDGSLGRSCTLYSEGDVLVCLNPPEIQNFQYDRPTNTLHARITDQGTPPEALAISLQLAGYRLTAEFDPATGEMTATLPFLPLSVQTAALSVTDRARQTTTANCTVLGRIEPQNEGTSEDPSPAIRGPFISSEALRGGEKVIGVTAGGKSIVESCRETMQLGYYRDGRFVPLDGSPESIRLVQLRARDRQQTQSLGQALSTNLPLELQVLGEEYDRNLFEPMATSSGGVTSLSMTPEIAPAGAARTIYFVVLARDGNRILPLNDAGISIGMLFTCKQTRQCRVEERDVLAPVIRPAYDPAARRLTAKIHDHGMPLSQLAIDIEAHSDSRNNAVPWGHSSENGSRPSFTFDDGLFTCRFVPPPRGEFFTLQLSAEDRAGNRSTVFIDVVTPQTPPEVRLAAETQTSGRTVSRQGVQASAYLTAEARDDSRIVPEQTSLRLDGQVLPPFTMYSHTDAAGWQNQFNFKTGYVAGVAEGLHLAHFRATDAAGLWAETTSALDFRLAPLIYDFKTMPDAVRQIGGPALSAMIVDPGGDLDLDGLALTIDGEPIDTTHLFYDPVSGYFAVDGPLELTDGPHLAQITATDRHGNQSSESLRFSRTIEITMAGAGGGDGIAIEGLSLMELENHNGDGLANPGELVRLFVSLKNEGNDPLSCVARLSPEDPEIVVETESLAYAGLAPGSTAVPLKGFDLQVGSDILKKTISDPYEAYFDLTLTCNQGREWLLPLAIPIQRATVPGGEGLKVRLDRLPPSTAAREYRLQGTIRTRSEFIDWIEVRVNGDLQGPVDFDREGGHFEAVAALEEGSNAIEVTGADSAGARGSDTGYIFRTTAFAPPAIAITSPAGGDYFMCSNLTVTGTYDPGSGALERIRVEAPWRSGSCPVTIIDGSHFTVDCGDVILGPAGVYDIEATIETTDGVEAMDAVTVEVGSCS
jgi:hypothetical protein